MTNTFYDQAKPAPYRGALRICPECGAVVADDRKGRHEQWHDQQHQAIEEVETLEVTEWDPEDPAS